MNEVNGLFPTRTRRALLHAIDDGNGRIYYEAREVWDKSIAWKVTKRVEELISHDWIRALTPDEPRGPGEWKTRTYYRLTDNGRRVLNQEAMK